MDPILHLVRAPTSGASDVEPLLLADIMDRISRARGKEQKRAAPITSSLASTGVSHLWGMIYGSLVREEMKNII